jgi:hypothetical protein
MGNCLIGFLLESVILLVFPQEIRQKEFIMQARQGDIFFKTVKNVPKNLKKKTDNILAYGEVTGHSHKIMSPSISEMESFVDENGDIYVLSPNSEIRIGHDEHDVIVLPKNEWICVSRQREFDVLAVEKERKVAD